jgi:hypothetical protein
MAFGIIEPNHHFTFAVGGATFEFIEDFMAGNKNTKLVNCSKNPKSFMCNGIQDGYWYGKFDDILINILGYTLGSALRTNVFPLIKCIN